MPKERILSKKFEQLDNLKLALVSRSNEEKEEIIEKIKETVDDLEIILDDFDYINTSNEEENRNMRSENNISNEPGKQFTLVDLLNYDGQEGRPVYVAVDGIVYDLGKIPSWKGGKHYGAEAGKNMTRTFYQGHPKNVEILNKADIVGILVTD